jgi:CelD/BcsL family acetyltransferase involved in cellulose biosynthesis
VPRSDEGRDLVTRVVHADALTPEEVTCWSAIRQSVPSLASAYFSPIFTSIVASARTDVRVAILEDREQPVGFFPFQRGRFGTGRPVGTILSDLHGAVVAPDVSLDAQALIGASGLKLWEFHHLLASQAAFEPFHQVRRDSMQIDLEAGFETYLGGVEAAHGHSMRHLRRKTRKLEREHGLLSFVHHDGDSAALEKLFEWKADQYTKTGTVNILEQRWVRDVLRQVHATQSDDFRGLLSFLLAEGRPVAAHLGMRSAGALHYWFPAYDPEFASYSPGLILLLKLAEASRAAGVDTIDLGTGDYEFKRMLMNRVVVVAEGAVETRSAIAKAIRVRRTAKALIRRAGVAPSLRRIARRVPGLR